MLRPASRPLAVSLLVVAGCAPAPPVVPTDPVVVEAVPEATATAAAPEVPSASAGPPRAAVAAGVGIAPGQSLGGVPVGASADEVKRLLGPPEEISTHDKG